MSGPEMYAKVAQLKQRDLVQRRSVWRAVLPHAIANRLAKMALEQIPFEAIVEQLTTQRLLRSFTRRLSYLHESEAAVRIATDWLEPDGYLGAVENLNQFGQALLANLAPVAPEAMLTAIERAIAAPGSDLVQDYGFRNRFISTLHSIAYDASLFDRCVAILISMAITEPTQNNHPATTSLENLFHLFYSGTHAPVEQRARIADRLLSSSEPEERKLGQKVLDSLLEADNFMATHSFEFGSRARDYGYWPATRAERIHWFVQALRLARKHAVRGENVPFVREQMASAIRAIWVLGPEVQQEFEKFADDLGRGGYPLLNIPRLQPTLKFTQPIDTLCVRPSVMLTWCDEAQERRYLALARVVTFFTQNEKEPVEWSPLALAMLDRAPDPVVVLRTFVQRFVPRSWSGSLAEIVESRAGLLDRLPLRHAASFVESIASLKAQLATKIANRRRQENERDQVRDERFE